MTSNSFIRRKNLPHWRTDGVIYWVTWRLHRFQPPMNEEEKQLVFDAMSHFDGDRYLLGPYVVMDDHVHAMLCPLTESLDEILRSRRSFTANQLQRHHNRTGEIWQSEPWDHIIRNSEEAAEKARYMLENPFRRSPQLREYTFLGHGQLEWQAAL